jgi:hypothetical protein
MFRRIAIIFALTISAQAHAQNVILVLGTDGSPNHPELAEISRLETEARIVALPDLSTPAALSSAAGLLREGESVALIVMTGSSVRDLAKLNSDFDSIGKNAGLALGLALPVKALSPSLLIHFWNCSGDCNEIVEQKFQDDFRDSLMKILKKDRPEQSLVMASNLSKIKISRGRTLLKLLVSGASASFRGLKIASETIRSHLPSPIAGLRRAGTIYRNSLRWTLPLSAMVVSLTSFDTYSQIAGGVALSSLWLLAATDNPLRRQVLHRRTLFREKIEPVSGTCQMLIL